MTMLARISRKLLVDSLGKNTNQQYLKTVVFRSPITRCMSQQTPVNTIFMFVPEQEAWIVERMGKFHRILEPGLNILIPIIDKIRYVQCLKEIPIEINQKTAITSDNVTLSIDSVLFLKIKDPHLASYGVDDPEYAICQLAKTTVRSELAKVSLDDILQENGNINDNVIKSINKASETWGITCLRYEIRDIHLPPSIQEALKVLAETHRKKKAAILESEGVRAAEINIAEGKREAKIIESEAEKVEMINRANGEATASCIIAEARAKNISIIADALKNQSGPKAASFVIAQQYVSAFERMARTNNTLIVPNNACDISQVVAKALSTNEDVPENLQSHVTKNIDKIKTIS